MSSEIFIVNRQKAKHLYEIQNDGTSVDYFVINLKQEFNDTFLAISVRGLSARKNNFNFKQLPYGFPQKALYWKNPVEDKTKIREYYLKLYVNFAKFPFKVCSMTWVPSVDSRLKNGTEEDFLFNRERAYRLIETFFKKHSVFFMVSVFCGVLPQSSWSTRCYVKLF